jgi:hypothetical protein
MIPAEPDWAPSKIFGYLIKDLTPPMIARIGADIQGLSKTISTKAAAQVAKYSTTVSELLVLARTGEASRNLTVFYFELLKQRSKSNYGNAVTFTFDCTKKPIKVGKHHFHIMNHDISYQLLVFDAIQSSILVLSPLDTPLAIPQEVETYLRSLCGSNGNYFMSSFIQLSDLPKCSIEHSAMYVMIFARMIANGYLPAVLNSDMALLRLFWEIRHSDIMNVE